MKKSTNLNLETSSIKSTPQTPDSAVQGCVASYFRIWARRLYSNKNRRLIVTVTMISPRAVHDIFTPKFIKLSRRQICIFTKTNTEIYFDSDSGDDKYFFRNSEIRFLRTAHQTEIGITVLTQGLYYKALKVCLGNPEVPDLSEVSKYCLLCSGVE